MTKYIKKGQPKSNVIDEHGEYLNKAGLSNKKRSVKYRKRIEKDYLGRLKDVKPSLKQRRIIEKCKKMADNIIKGKGFESDI